MFKNDSYICWRPLLFHFPAGPWRARATGCRSVARSACPQKDYYRSGSGRSPLRADRKEYATTSAGKWKLSDANHGAGTLWRRAICATNTVGGQTEGWASSPPNDWQERKRERYRFAPLGCGGVSGRRTGSLVFDWKTSQNPTFPLT